MGLSQVNSAALSDVYRVGVKSGKLCSTTRRVQVYRVGVKSGKLCSTTRRVQVYRVGVKSGKQSSTTRRVQVYRASQVTYAALPDVYRCIGLGLSGNLCSTTRHVQVYRVGVKSGKLCSTTRRVTSWVSVRVSLGLGCGLCNPNKR